MGYNGDMGNNGNVPICVGFGSIQRLKTMVAGAIGLHEKCKQVLTKSYDPGIGGIQ